MSRGESKLATMSPEELDDQAVKNWAEAKEHAELCERVWVDNNSPLTDTAHNGAEYEHALHKILREAREAEARRLKEIQRPAKTPGRKTLAQPQPAISESPASRRRRMKAV